MARQRVVPGRIRDAILAFLASREDRDASVTEILEAVEHTLGRKVARSSVQTYLQTNAGRRFERTSRGRYRMKN